jgi:uncharacterized membrane protein YcfT
MPRWNDEPTQQLRTLAPSPSPSRRVEWADVAKGGCIVLVVLWHVIMKHYLQIDWHLSVPLPGAWGAFGDQLLPLRMPVFFCVSGLFAAGAVHRPWRVAARGRIARFYYLYVLWFAIHTVVLSLVPRFDTLSARNLTDILEQLTITPTNLWYLLALAIYFAVARLTRALPAAVVLGAAFLLSAAASAGLLAAPGNRGQLYQNLLFFLAGLRLKPWLERWAREPRTRWLLAGSAVYLAVVPLVRHFGAAQWFGVWPVLSALAVLLGVAAAVEAHHRLAVASVLARLGRRTLPIYVMHLPILAVLHAVLLSLWSAAPAPVQLVLAALLPVAMTAVLVVACLGLHAGIRRLHGSWLFDLPNRRGRAAPPMPVTRPEDQPTVVLPRIS